MNTTDLIAAARAEAKEFKDVRDESARSGYFYRLEAVARHTKLPAHVLDLCAECERLQCEAVGWKDIAAQFLRNQEFYRGLIERIGNLFGQEAYISDDGSVQDSVLALKVPELVERLQARIHELEAEARR